MTNDRLLQVLSGPTAGPLVFAFPPSGAGPSLFRRWLPARPPGLELVVIHTPGRESRIGEPPVCSLTPLADEIADAIDGYAQRPYVIFGHSLGSLLGREVAVRLRRRSRPVSALVAACSAPPDVEGDPALDDPDDKILIETLRDWGAVPEEMADEDLVEVVLPAVRADMALARSCRLGRPPTAEDRLDIPIIAIVGDEDPLADVQSTGWAPWTDAAHTAHVMSGGHFFPFERPEAVLEILTRDAGHPGAPGPRTA